MWQRHSTVKLLVCKASGRVPCLAYVCPFVCTSLACTSCQGCMQTRSVRECLYCSRANCSSVGGRRATSHKSCILIANAPRAAAIAFVSYSTWAAAEAAMEALNGTTPVATQQNPLVVKFADGKPRQQPALTTAGGAVAAGGLAGVKRGRDGGAQGAVKRHMGTVRCACCAVLISALYPLIAFRWLHLRAVGSC
jgi:hypothetical protein